MGCSECENIMASTVYTERDRSAVLARQLVRDRRKGRIELEFASDGVFGSVDGRPVGLAWAEVDRTWLLDYALLIASKSGAFVHIARASLTKAGADCWSFLQRHLDEDRCIVLTSPDSAVSPS